MGFNSGLKGLIPSGISDLCGTVTGMVTPKGSMSTEGETLPVSVLPYRCSICPPLASVLGVAQSSSEVPEGLMNYPYICHEFKYFWARTDGILNVLRNKDIFSLKVY